MFDFMFSKTRRTKTVFEKEFRGKQLHFIVHIKTSCSFFI